MRAWIRPLWRRFIFYHFPLLLHQVFSSRWGWIGAALGFILMLGGLFLGPEVGESAFRSFLIIVFGKDRGLELFELIRPVVPWLFNRPGGILGSLLIIGWVAYHRWAAPRAAFWRAIHEAGIPVVWGGGDRMAFLQRLYEAGMQLGLGPTGKILERYVPLPEVETIKERLRQGRHVVIGGPAVAGKTRTAMEIAVALDPPFVLVWPSHPLAAHWPLSMQLPAPWAMILADNLGLRPGGERGSLPEILEGLLRRCKGLRLLATARAERIPPDLRGIEQVDLQPVRPDLPAIQDLIQEVAREEGRLDWEIRKRFMEYPAQLVAGLEAFRAKYQELSPMAQRVLQVLKVFREMGVRTFPVDRVWRGVEAAWDVSINPREREEIISELDHQHFLSIQRNQQVTVVYDALLDQVVKAPVEQEEIEKQLWEALKQAGDASAFVEIGNTWSEEYSPAYQRNPREALKRAIAAYGEALRFYIPEATPLEYAWTQNNLGLAYWALAQHEDPVGNLRRAIAAYKEALRFYTPQVTPLGYARIQDNLGAAYWALAQHEDPVRNLRRAIAAYEEALRFYTPQATPLDYARAQNNLGGTYQELAAHEDPVGNLWRAIAAYEEALRFYTPQATPLEYARTQHNLGLACLALANVETDTERGCEVLARAIRAFQEALRFRTPEATPRWHAETRKALEEALEKARAWGCPEASPYA